jgi:hypothetical protein
LKLFISALLLSFAFIGSSQAANQCHAGFNYGVIIEANRVRITEHGKTFIQINNNQQLFVNGREINLSAEQRELIRSYSIGLKQQVPQIVSVATDGIELSLDAVTKVIGGLTGENSDSQQKILETFNQLKTNMKSRFNQSEDSYFLAAQNFNELDQLIEGQFKHELKQIISQSVSSILVAVGEVMRNDEGFEQSNDIGERIDKITSDLSIDIHDKASQLRDKVDLFCQSLSPINESEKLLNQHIPALNNFDLIRIENNNF